MTPAAAGRSWPTEPRERGCGSGTLSYSDGGGLARASRIPVVSSERVAKYLRAFHTRFWEGSIHIVDSNGAPAAVLVRDGAVVAHLALDVTAEGIRHLLWTLNPEKLERLPVPGEAPE